MGDLSLPYGGDLAISPSGDYAVISGDVLMRERVIRRLCTNPRVVLDDGTVLDAEWLEAPTYGAGLGRLVGKTVGQTDLGAIENAVRQALAAEPTVDQTQPPTIQVSQLANGRVRVLIAPVSAATGKPVAIPPLVIQP